MFFSKSREIKAPLFPSDVTCAFNSDIFDKLQWFLWSKWMWFLIPSQECWNLWGNLSVCCHWSSIHGGSQDSGTVRGTGRGTQRLCLNSQVGFTSVKKKKQLKYKCFQHCLHRVLLDKEWKVAFNHFSKSDV